LLKFDYFKVCDSFWGGVIALKTHSFSAVFLQDEAYAVNFFRCHRKTELFVKKEVTGKKKLKLLVWCHHILLPANLILTKWVL